MFAIKNLWRIKASISLSFTLQLRNVRGNTFGQKPFGN